MSLSWLWNAYRPRFRQPRHPAALAAFGQVLMIDIMLAGDNAIVVGALAAGLPAEQRKKVIMIGIIAALVLRIVFALLVTQLMQIVGLILAGGILLLWVRWKMYRELRHAPRRSRDRRRRGVAACSPAKSFAARRLGGRGRRRLDEPRQRAGGRRRGARPSRHPDHRPAAVGRPDGHRRQFHRQIYRALPLDRLGRPAS